MNYKYIFVSISMLLSLIHCTTNKKSTNEQDLKKIEILLSKHKRYAFIDLYRKSLRQEEKKYHVKKCDSLLDVSSTELYNENCLKADFYSDDHKSYNDENYNLLILKWLKKDYPVYMPTDNPDVRTTMTFKKALDFYESDDLNKYIDSLRILFYKKYERHNLKSIDCVE
ncbi:hypothetical protein ODZ84_15900 [Chryseobacterium fluminis]|uniref:hypothetical protein n=1 Tax=Chryseobacterium fluminis TaxID=2983606 RepID=UPI00225075EA|nr:hypothetical protein [Chryseobacterium sp. MMS21-Ot14]UZT96699.1 hypothetical protein ODZ84_15900 [Chryseobacterium sp. MMS21-Ot14]